MTKDAKWMVSDDSDTFDVVVSILERHRDLLAKINRQNSEIFCGSGLMDQIRMEQIDDINLAIQQRQAKVLYNPYTGLPRDPRDIETDPCGILIEPPNTPLKPAPQVLETSQEPVVEGFVKRACPYCESMWYGQRDDTTKYD